MSYKLTITQKPQYLHVVVTGLNTKENVARYIEDIRRECSVRDCFLVLIEERLEGPRLSTADVFQIIAEESKQPRANFAAIAYVDVNAEGDLMKFAETVAVNRGFPVRVFSSIRDAKKWLLSKDRDDTV